MKIKYFFAMLAAALVMTNCSHEEEVVESSMGKVRSITATIEGASRSTVNDGGVFSWTGGDKISVGTTNGFVTFTYDEKTGKFKHEDGFSGSISGYAVYPAYEDSKEYNGKDIPSIKMPVSFSSGTTNAPLLAEIPANSVGENVNLTFKHLGGLMRFIVKDVPADANKFVFTTTSKKIAGEFEVKKNTEGVNCIMAGDNPDKAENNVTVGFNHSTKQDMIFYVPLPVGEYSGYSVRIKGDNLELSDGEQSKNAANVVNRASLLLMPEFTCDVKNNKIQKGSGSFVKLEGGVQDMTVTGNDETITVGTSSNPNAVLNLNLISSGENSQFEINDGVSGASEQSKATVNVSAPDNSNISSLEISAPTLTVELSAKSGESVEYKQVTALTALNTLNINDGVTVEELIINGGHVIIKDDANVTTIKNNTENTLYVLNKNTSSTPTVSTPEDGKGATIFVSNESELALRVAADNGGDVVLQEDVTLTETLTIASGKTVTLDLNTHTLAYTSAVQNEAMILNKGTLTIKNGTVTYQYTGAADNTTSTGNYTINNTGKLIVEANINAVAGEEGKKFSHAFYAINTSGETIIKSGKILNNTNNAIRQWVGSETKSSDITVEGGEIEGLRAIWIQLPNSDKTKAPLGNLTIKNGTLTGTAIDGTQDSGYVNAIYAYSYGNQMKNVEINIYNGDIYGDLQLTGGRSGAKVDVEKVTITGGTFHGHNGERVFGVVSWAADDLTSEAITIKGGTFYHPYPLNYMEGDNGTIDIKLARDLSYEDNDGQEDNKPIVVPAGNTVTLDLNGKTLSREKAQTDTYAMITNKGTLTIKDTSAEKNGKISYADITEYTAAIGYASNTIRNEGTLTLVSGTIENISDENVRNNGYPHAIDVYPGSTTNIEGGTVESANYDCIRMFCNSETLATTVKISEGKIINRVTFQNPNNSTNTPGYGRLNISGGTFTTTTDYVTANVRLLNFSNDVSNMKAEITGGTFDKGVKTQDLSSSWKEDWNWLTIKNNVSINIIEN